MCQCTILNLNKRVRIRLAVIPSVPNNSRVASLIALLLRKTALSSLRLIIADSLDRVKTALVCLLQSNCFLPRNRFSWSIKVSTGKSSAKWKSIAHHCYREIVAASSSTFQLSLIYKHT